MKFMKRAVLWSVVMALAVPVPAITAEWKPKKAIHMVIPTGPGGTYDSIGRVLASEMAKIVGQPVVVENVPGAGQALSAVQVYNAKPDGYTILYNNTMSMIINQYVYGAKYDFRKFDYLGQVYDTTKSPTTTVASGTKSGLNSWNDVLKLGRPVRFGTVGKGSIPHITGVALAYAFGLKNPTYILGYTGGADAFGGVARGEADLVCFPWNLVDPYIKSGDLQFLMVFSKKERLANYPNIPTAGELGHPELVDQTGTQHILMTPPGTPKEHRR